MKYKDFMDNINNLESFKKTNLNKFDIMEIVEHTSKVNNYDLVCNGKEVKSVKIKNNIIFLEV